MNQSRTITSTSIMLFIIIAILPVVLMFWRSLFPDHSFGFENYFALFSDPRQITLFCRSLGLASAAAFLSVLIGVPFAFLIARTDVPGRNILKALYLLPLCIPPYIHVIAWIYLLGENSPVIAYIAKQFSLGTPLPLINIYCTAGSAVILCLSYFPFVVLLTLTGLLSMDQRLEEAARLQYKPFKVLCRVTLPLISPYIFSGAVFVFIFSLFNYGVPSLLRVHTYPVEIFAQFSAFYNEGLATAQSFPLVIMALSLLILQRYYMGSRSYVTMDTGMSGSVPISLGRFRILAGGYSFFIIFFSVFFPIGFLVVQTGSWESVSAALRTSSGAIFTTLFLALISATAIVCLSFVLSRLIEDKQFKGRTALDFMTFIPFSFPATVLGIGLIYFWNWSITELIYKGSLILVIAYAARFIPFSVRVLNSNFKQISPSLKEAAMLSEKSWLKRIIKIDIPLSAQGLAAGWIIAFILCMGELGTTLLVIPPGKGTIALKIYTLMHYGANQIVASLSLILILINLFFCTAVVFGLKQKWQTAWIKR